MKYTSIDSILYDISTLMGDKQFNAKKFKEWAILGFKKLASYNKYRELFFIGVVSDHKILLPDNFIHPLQIAYINTTSIDLIPELQEAMNLKDSKYNPALQYITDPESLPEKAASLIKTYSWKPLRLGSSTFSKIVHVPESMLYSAFNSTCTECEHTYAIDGDCLITSFKDGYILMSYLGYPVDDNNSILIPDLPDLKEALTHFVLYRYYLSKSLIKEQNSLELANYHLNRYTILKTKSTGILDSPTIDNLENILHQRNRIINSTQHYSSFFANLNSKVNE